jgi:hypothetical protein
MRRVELGRVCDMYEIERDEAFGAQEQFGARWKTDIGQRETSAVAAQRASQRAATPVSEVTPGCEGLERMTRRWSAGYSLSIALRRVGRFAVGTVRWIRRTRSRCWRAKSTSASSFPTRVSKPSWVVDYERPGRRMGEHGCDGCAVRAYEV